MTKKKSALNSIFYVGLLTIPSISNAAEEGAFPLHNGHVDQQLIRSGDLGFTRLFDDGDELFEARYNSIDGGGVNLKGDAEITLRYSRVPDVNNPGFSNDPHRVTGPNARGCSGCHNEPFDDGSGDNVKNAHRDPMRQGQLSQFIQRNTPHVLGSGALQRLAEEATEDLMAIRDDAVTAAAIRNKPVKKHLVTGNRIKYGSITAFPDGSIDTSQVEGVDNDLVVKPYQWKGTVAFLRDFMRGASTNEIGMQPVEMYGEGTDNDNDGVSDEFTVGDITALTLYVAAQPRPVTIFELNAMDAATYPLSNNEANNIIRGEGYFNKIGCSSCHTPVMQLSNADFAEPSSNPNFRDTVFPSGDSPETLGLEVSNPVIFDLTSPDDMETPFESNGNGGAYVRLYSDLKRHEMGSALAENVDEAGTGSSTWMTETLWGVGDTAPWMHDGQSTTLTGAILRHGGESQDARDKFSKLTESKQDMILDFLNSLRLFKAE